MKFSQRIRQFSVSAHYDYVMACPQDEDEGVDLQIWWVPGNIGYYISKQSLTTDKGGPPGL